MSFLITILQKIGRLLLSVVRVLRRAVCCRRRRRESEMLLPLTVSYTSSARDEAPDFHDWNSWDENELNNSIPTDNSQSNVENSQEEDFFKDMVPQFRKPKKFIVKEPVQENESSGHSSRLAMDPRAFPMPFYGPSYDDYGYDYGFASPPRAYPGRVPPPPHPERQPELGLIEDNPSVFQPDQWGEVESPDENWDTDSLIREKKLAEREKRLAEHQRRKLEKENKRAYKQAAGSANAFYITETAERAKYS